MDTMDPFVKSYLEMETREACKNTSWILNFDGNKIGFVKLGINNIIEVDE